MNIKKSYLLSIVLGILIGITSYQISYKKLLIYYDYNKSNFTSEDVINQIFINNRFRAIEYLDETDITILMIPITFLIIGFILSAEFLHKPKSYYCFIGARSHNYFDMRKHIYGNQMITALFYSCSYFVSIYFMCRSVSIMFKAIGMSATYFLLILFVSRISFLICEKYNGAAALIFGMILILILYLIDMYIEGIHIVLYDSKNFSVYNIVTLIALIGIIILIEKKVIKRRLMYVF